MGTLQSSECVCVPVKFKETILIQGSWNGNLVASQIEKVQSIHPFLLLHEIMLAPWLFFFIIFKDFFIIYLFF